MIILNGPGSVGKSTVARCLQAASARPLLQVAMDAFLDMLPERFQDHPEGVHYVTSGRRVVVRVGPVGHRLLLGLRASVVALADAGNDLILDHVLDASGLADYHAALSGHAVLTVGLHAPLEVLEVRERARGDRMPGLSRDQIEWVHAGQHYDLTIDTSTTPPEACADRIIAALS